MKPRFNLLLGSLLALSFTHQSLAATYNWIGGSGNWDTTTANWSGAGTLWPAVSTLDDDAVFAGTSGTVTIATGGVTANDLTFNTTGYTIGGAALTLDGTTPTLSTATGVSATVSSVIAGAAGLRKSGDGILTLSGTNTFTGENTVTAGTVVVQNNAAFGAATNTTTVNAGTALDLGGNMAANGLNQGARSFTVSGTGVAGTGVLTSTATNTQINAISKVVLAGDSTFGGSQRWDMRNNTPTLNMAGFTLTKTGPNYIGIIAAGVTPDNGSNTGDIIVNQGELSISTSTNLNGDSDNTVTVNSGATLSFYQSSNAPLWTLNLNNGSTLRGENGTATQNTWAGPVTAAGEVTLRAEGGHNLNLGGAISGTANLAKTATGTATIGSTGSIATTGNLAVSAGTLTVNGSLAHSGNLAITGASVNINGPSSFPGTTTVTNGNLTLNYATDDNGKLPNGQPLTLAGGTLTLSGGTHPEIVASTTLAANTSNSITQADSTAATIALNALTRNAGAALNLSADNIATTDTLNNANGFLGTWATVGGNHWAINSANAPDGPISSLTDFVYTFDLADDADLYLNKHVNVDTVQVPDAAINPRSLIFNTAAANSLTLQGTNVISSGGILVGSGVGANASLLTGGSITGPASGELVINQRNTTALTISSTIVDNTVTHLSKLGTGTAILTGSHPYTGTTTVGTGGTLQLGDGLTDGSLAGTSGIAIYGNLGYNLLNNFTHSIPLSGTGSLTKTGAATLTVANSNPDFTGSVNVNGGTLVIAHKNALANSSSIFASTTAGGGTVRFATDESIAINRIESSSSNPGKLVSDRATTGAGINHIIPAAWFGANTYTFEAGPNVTTGTAGITFNSVNLTAGSASTAVLNPTTAVVTINGPVNIGLNNFAKTLRLSGDNSGNLISGVISNGINTLSVLKNGPGTWELSGDNTYTGQTSVNNGTLILSSNRTATAGQINVGDVAGETGVLNIQGNLTMGANPISVGATAAGAIGIVNHSAGTVTFSGGGNAVLIGRTTGGVSGTYNLSGGTLTPASSTGNRGVMIGVNAGSAGNLINATFNLSDSGFLNNTGGAGTLQVVRGDSTSGFQNSTYNQTGGTSNNLNLLIGGNGANGADSIATFSVTGGIFTANNFTNLSRGNNVASTLTIGGTADVTLPAFPTARGTNSTATLNFDGGVLKPTATSPAYLGGLTNAFIKAGGAKFNTSGFDITVSQNLLTDPVSTGGSLTKEGAGSLFLTGTNTYTGNTTVTAGTLSLGNGTANTNLANGADVSVASGATLNLNYSGTDTIDELILNGVAKSAGVWGSSTSGAPNTDPQLTGSGTLTVTTGPASSNYTQWASGYGLTGSNAAFDFDFDNDGIKNGLEWILGGNPITNSADVLPDPTRTPSGDLVLTFTREEDAIAETTLKVQFGTTLASWPKEAVIGATNSGPDANGVTVNINTAASPDAVTVTIPAANAAGGRIFARLIATQP